MARLLLRLGGTVGCRDGAYGELADLVLQPGSRCVTHLVVAPHGQQERAQLVPLELAAEQPEPGAPLCLTCTLADARDLPEVHEYAYLRIDEKPPLRREGETVGIEDVVAMPVVYDGAPLELGPLSYDEHLSVTYDRIPRGEVEVRRSSEVQGSDGERIGQLAGVEVERDGTLAHLLVRRGHFWHRRVTVVPASAVAHVDMDGVTLSVTRGGVDALGRGGDRS